MSRESALILPQKSALVIRWRKRRSRHGSFPFVSTQVEFYTGSTLIGTATTAPYNVTWNNVLPGNYSLTANSARRRVRVSHGVDNGRAS